MDTHTFTSARTRASSLSNKDAKKYAVSILPSKQRDLIHTCLLADSCCAHPKRTSIRPWLSSGRRRASRCLHHQHCRPARGVGQPAAGAAKQQQAGRGRGQQEESQGRPAPPPPLQNAVSAQKNSYSSTSSVVDRSALTPSPETGSDVVAKPLARVETDWRDVGDIL